MVDWTWPTFWGHSPLVLFILYIEPCTLLQLTIPTVCAHPSPWCGCGLTIHVYVTLIAVYGPRYITLPGRTHGLRYIVTTAPHCGYAVVTHLYLRYPLFVMDTGLLFLLLLRLRTLRCYRTTLPVRDTLHTYAFLRFYSIHGCYLRTVVTTLHHST